MLFDFAADRPFLDGKFNTYDGVPYGIDRFSLRGWEYDAASGLSDDEIRGGLDEILRVGQAHGDDHAVIKARGFSYILKNTRIGCDEHDLFIGLSASGRLLRSIYNVWYGEIFGDGGKFADVERDRQTQYRSGAMMIWIDYDHCVPDWDALLSLGFAGIRARARDYRRVHEENAPLTPRECAFFDSIEITYTAIIDFLHRYAAYARTHINDKAEAVALSCEHIADGAPQTTYEALQLIWSYWYLSEHVDLLQVRSLSNIDVTMRPFVERDLATGRYTDGEIDELFRYFLYQFASIGNYWGQPVYFGGTNPDGTTKINPLSYRLLRLYDDMGIYNPKLQIKLSDSTPKEFTQYALDMIRRGHNSIVFVCEPYVIDSLLSAGVPYEKALDCDITGCYEFAVKADSAGTGPAYLSLVKPFEYIFNNGRDMATDAPEGLPCDLGSLHTFEDFLHAYYAQLAHMTDHCILIVDKLESVLYDCGPAPMFSGTIRRGLERAQDAYSGGAAYCGTVILYIGSGSAANCLTAIKKFIYDEPYMTLGEMRDAMMNDWRGFEKQQARIKRDPDKYGNGRSLPDTFFKAITSYTARLVNGRRNTRGDFYTVNFHTAHTHIDMGLVVASSPDGRAKGEEFSKNCSPVPGTDREGATAFIRSALINSSVISGDYPIDVALHPTAVKGEDGMDALYALLMTYLHGHGHAVHFNILDPDVLKKAQEHPEQYGNLQIRVCGWNVRFVNMSRAEQDAFILRAENIT